MYTYMIVMGISVSFVIGVICGIEVSRQKLYEEMSNADTYPGGDIYPFCEGSDSGLGEAAPEATGARYWKKQVPSDIPRAPRGA